MIDVENLRKAVSHFKFQASPSGTDQSKPVTIKDINRMIESVFKLFESFIDEIESNQKDLR